MMKSVKRIYSDHKMISMFYISGVVAMILLSLFIYFSWPTFDADMSGLIRQDRGNSF